MNKFKKITTKLINDYDFEVTARSLFTGRRLESLEDDCAVLELTLKFSSIDLETSLALQKAFNCPLD